MQQLFRRLGAAAFFLTLATCANALTVRAERPDWFKALNQNSAWNITLHGAIDADSPRLVAEALKKAGTDGADIYFDSQGGNLLAGMKIGRMIRQAGANTHIGKLVPDPGNTFAGKAGVKSLPGNCYSACTLAYLGGVYRYTDEKSQFGVHRFSSAKGPADTDLDTAQILSAAISNYIREMDVDPGLFDLMVQEGKDGIRVLNSRELTRLNVVNNGRKRPQWSIEAVDGGMYVRGVQDSIYGQGKVVLYCENHEMLFQSYYQAGPARATSIQSGGWYHSLLVDGDPLPLSDPFHIKASGAEIATMFLLTESQVLAIAAGTSVGHAMQLARDAPTFVGYNVDIPPESTQRVRTYIRNCLRR